MRYHVEQSQSGGWSVRAAGFDRALSRHDTEEEAQQAAAELERPDADPQAVASRLDAAAERLRLRDGSLVLIRPVTPADRQLFVDGFERFGTESRQNRFLTAKKQLTDAELDFLTQVDQASHAAIGALDPETGAGIGVARMVRDPGCGDDCAEAAVAVVDDWQGRGVGAALLERLAARARELGIRRFAAVLRTGNRAMLTLFERTGEMRVRRRDGNVVTIEVELPVDDHDGTLAAALRSAAAGRIEQTSRSGS